MGTNETPHTVADQATSRRARLSLTLPGVVAAVVLACLSFTPSLLPRPPLFQGVLTGLDAAIGYGLGILAAWVWRAFPDRPARRASRRSWLVVGVVSAVALLVSLGLGAWWQNEAHALADTGPQPVVYVLLVPPVAVVMAMLVIAAGRGVRGLTRGIGRVLARLMGPRAARALGVLFVAVLGVMLASGVLWSNLVEIVDESFAVRDQSTPDGVVRPTTPLRSGSDESLIPWDSLGREGRVFVGTGPTAKEISEVTGRPALEPIRIYSGLSSAADPEKRAAVAVSDLERAGGFERSALLVVTTTGTGWVEPSSVAAFEHLTDGDAAIVGMQYSHLPSWMSFLVDGERAREAARQLFDAVYARVSALPAEDRPRVYVFGESLGSFGGEDAFSGKFDLSLRTSGALFVGPPNFNPLYRSFIDGRDPGSPEIEPVYRGGSTVRFAVRADRSIPPDDSAWEGSRVLYLQHASDPVTWWSPRLLVERPDWLEEPRGGDVPDAMTWIPLVTFWHVSADLAVAFSTQPGHGHNFSGEHVAGWAAVLQPPDWTDGQLAELRAQLQRFPGDE